MTNEERAKLAERIKAAMRSSLMNNKVEAEMSLLVDRLRDAPTQTLSSFINDATPDQKAAVYGRVIAKSTEQQAAMLADAPQAPESRKPLTDDQITGIWAGVSDYNEDTCIYKLARAIERAHGITGEAA